MASKNKAAGKLIYITTEDAGTDDAYDAIAHSLEDAYAQTGQGPADTVVSVYKLVRTVKVTRNVTFTEEVL